MPAETDLPISLIALKLGHALGYLFLRCAVDRRTAVYIAAQIQLINIKAFWLDTV